jgi:hypothetical protein
MRNINLYRISICLLACFITATGHAQKDFTYKAAINEIPATGFYKIDITPSVVAKCKPGLEDVRIFDEDKNQVAYILKNELPVFKKENFTQFPLLKTVKGKDNQTHIIFKNTSAGLVNGLLLFIKNMDANRTISITGSDDSINWFIIKENVYLENAFNNDGDNSIHALSFPRSNYKYFQLTILGKNVIPFNIIKAGIYNEDVVYGRYIQIPKPVITQKDSSDKNSYVSLKFEDAYLVNKIIIDAEGPKYFKRNFSIGGSYKNNDDILHDGFLASGSQNNFIINSRKNTLFLNIKNEDDIPLKVKSAEAFQLNISMLTYLQAGKKYYLYFGDSSALHPKYDLQFFADSIKINPAGVSFGSVEKNKIPGNRSESFFSRYSIWALWIIIIGILVILCFFTFKMVREVDKKKESNK